MERIVSNEELYDKISNIESSLMEIKDLLLHVHEDTSKIQQRHRSIAEQFGINVVSNIIADELVFRPLRKFRGEL